MKLPLHTLGWCMLVSALATGCSETDVEASPVCLNNVVEPGETCDDGNRINVDACTNSCELARCGDGVTRVDLSANNDAAEQCDDG
ncbi:MAG: hypothetical protein OSB21_14170, partial [Myxococcota bacterium]|nr:hypothetical protein [Myxococcota bacterium]